MDAEEVTLLAVQGKTSQGALWCAQRPLRRCPHQLQRMLRQAIAPALRRLQQATAKPGPGASAAARRRQQELVAASAGTIGSQRLLQAFLAAPEHVLHSSLELLSVLQAMLDLQIPVAAFEMGERLFLPAGARYSEVCSHYYHLARDWGHPRADERLSLVRFKFNSNREARSAYDYWKRQADANEPRALYFQYEHLFRKIGAPQDDLVDGARNKQHLIEAAKGGMPIAELKLGMLLCIQHANIPQWTTEAFHWLQRASADDSGAAKFLLALFHAKGVGTTPNLIKANWLLLQCVEQLPVAGFCMASPSAISKWLYTPPSQLAGPAVCKLSLCFLSGLSLEPNNEKFKSLCPEGSSAARELKMLPVAALAEVPPFHDHVFWCVGASCNVLVDSLCIGSSYTRLVARTTDDSVREAYSTAQTPALQRLLNVVESCQGVDRDLAMLFAFHMGCPAADELGALVTAMELHYNCGFWSLGKDESKLLSLPVAPYVLDSITLTDPELLFCRLMTYRVLEEDHPALLLAELGALRGEPRCCATLAAIYLESIDVHEDPKAAEKALSAAIYHARELNWKGLWVPIAAIFVLALQQGKEAAFRSCLDVLKAVNDSPLMDTLIKLMSDSHSLNKMSATQRKVQEQRFLQAGRHVKYMYFPLQELQQCISMDPAPSPSNDVLSGHIRDYLTHIAAAAQEQAEQGDLEEAIDAVLALDLSPPPVEPPPAWPQTAPCPRIFGTSRREVFSLAVGEMEDLIARGTGRAQHELKFVGMSCRWQPDMFVGKSVEEVAAEASIAAAAVAAARKSSEVQKGSASGNNDQSGPQPEGVLSGPALKFNGSQILPPEVIRGKVDLVGVLEMSKPNLPFGAPPPRQERPWWTPILYENDDEPYGDLVSAERTCGRLLPRYSLSSSKIMDAKTSFSIISAESLALVAEMRAWMAEAAKAEPTASLAKADLARLLALVNEARPKFPGTWDSEVPVGGLTLTLHNGLMRERWQIQIWTLMHRVRVMPLEVLRALLQSFGLSIRGKRNTLELRLAGLLLAGLHSG